MNSGARYDLGLGPDYFAVWDRTLTASEPLARFPRTDSGWTQAWDYFNRAEGSPGVPLRTATPEPASSGAASAGGVLGIVGFVLGWIPILGIFLGLILGLLAIVLGAVGLGQTKGGQPGHGMAVTGVVLGILIMVMKLIPGINLL
jgi:hypothetical protein